MVVQAKDTRTQKSQSFFVLYMYILQVGNNFPSLTLLFLETMLETSQTTIRKLLRLVEYMFDKFEVLMS